MATGKTRSINIYPNLMFFRDTMFSVPPPSPPHAKALQHATVTPTPIFDTVIDDPYSKNLVDFGENRIIKMTDGDHIVKI